MALKIITYKGYILLITLAIISVIFSFPQETKAANIVGHGDYYRGCVTTASPKTVTGIISEGQDRYLLVYVGTGSDVGASTINIDSITYNGDSLTALKVGGSLSTNEFSSSNMFRVYGLVNPDEGTYDLVVNFTPVGGAWALYYSASIFYNVNQDLPYSFTNGFRSTGTGTSATGTILGYPDGSLGVGFLSINTSTGVSSSTPDTSVFQPWQASCGTAGTTRHQHAGWYKNGISGSIAFSSTLSVSQLWDVEVLYLNPSVTVSPDTKFLDYWNFNTTFLLLFFSVTIFLLIALFSLLVFRG